MGYNLQLLEVDFKELLRVPGSNNAELLEQVLPHIWEEDQGELDDDEEPELATPKEALRQIVSGNVPREEWGGFPYYEALSALYMHLATSGDEIGMSSSEIGHMQAVEDALAAAGAKPPLSLLELVHRGVPFRVPQHDDFPCLGYLTPEEVLDAARQYDNLALDTMPEGPRETVEKLGALLKDAAARNHGLVGVLS